jgi:hypothetical protein
MEEWWGKPPGAAVHLQDNESVLGGGGGGGLGVGGGWVGGGGAGGWGVGGGGKGSSPCPIVFLSWGRTQEVSDPQ